MKSGKFVKTPSIYRKEWVPFRDEIQREDFGPIRPVYAPNPEPRMDLSSVEAAQATACAIERWAKVKATNDALQSSEEESAVNFLRDIIKEATAIVEKAFRANQADGCPTPQSWDAALGLMWSIFESIEHEGCDRPAPEEVFKQMALRLAYHPWRRDCLMQYIEGACSLTG